MRDRADFKGDGAAEKVFASLINHHRASSLRPSVAEHHAGSIC